MTIRGVATAGHGTPAGRNPPTASRPAVAAVTAAATGAIVWLAGAATALAASPTPDAGGGDPRSSGQGPGLVGDPLFALAGVVAIGLLAVILTLAWVRLTAHQDG